MIKWILSDQPQHHQKLINCPFYALKWDEDTNGQANQQSEERRREERQTQSEEGYQEALEDG